MINGKFDIFEFISVLILLALVYLACNDAKADTEIQVSPFITGTQVWWSVNGSKRAESYDGKFIYYGPWDFPPETIHEFKTVLQTEDGVSYQSEPFTVKIVPPNPSLKIESIQIKIQ